MISRRNIQGFSLLEILLVLVILAIAASLIVPALVKPAGTQLRTAAGSVAAGLRLARNAAVDSHEDVQFVVHLDRKVFVVGSSARERKFPEEMAVSVFTARSEVLGERRAAIRFFADGSSTGGRITLTQGERRYYIDVDWMTGQVQVRTDAAAGASGQGPSSNSVQLKS
jgi:general secretion pathway protein H